MILNVILVHLLIFLLLFSFYFACKNWAVGKLLSGCVRCLTKSEALGGLNIKIQWVSFSENINNWNMFPYQSDLVLNSVGVFWELYYIDQFKRQWMLPVSYKSAFVWLSLGMGSPSGSDRAEWCDEVALGERRRGWALRSNALTLGPSPGCPPGMMPLSLVTKLVPQRALDVVFFFLQTLILLVTFCGTAHKYRYKRGTTEA